MSRVLPILFNTDMVRAILDGKKTVTRRICKEANELTVPDMSFYDAEKRTYAVHNFADKEHTDQLSTAERTCPICPGDILYVRETWNTYCEGCVSKNLESILGSACSHACGENGNGYYYKATDKNHVRWRPSIHMPKEAARIWLKVKDVRVERLQEIAEEQAKAEGAIDNRGFIHSPDNEYDSIHTAKEHFKQFWNSTIKKSDFDPYGWEANPWVWVIEFERCERPEGWCV